MQRLQSYYFNPYKPSIVLILKYIYVLILFHNNK